MIKIPLFRAAGIAFVFAITGMNAPLYAQSYGTDQSLTMKRDLAGVLGEAHYIRTLCNGANDQYWRNYMRDFLKHEGISKERKSLFTTAFNRGYKFQSERLFRCDSAVASLEVTLASKGRKMAETLAAQYMQ
ncbi:TIGR02301 family protein [Hirschia litorea]|uniref:TIGR02301 family protein n=1 Tax=Hirschia litorea TaxID=1199156 RepID=A0ABW2IIQ2_9PROT